MDYIQIGKRQTQILAFARRSAGSSTSIGLFSDSSAMTDTPKLER